MLVLPASAQATSITPEGSTIKVVGSPGEASQISLNTDATTIYFSEVQDGAFVPYGACTVTGDKTAECPRAGITSISASLGDNNDSWMDYNDGAAISQTVDLGAGDDTAFTGDAADVLVGGAGKDSLLARGGADTLDAVDGAITDNVTCNAGVDVARIDHRTTGELTEDLLLGDDDCETVERVTAATPWGAIVSGDGLLKYFATPGSVNNVTVLSAGNTAWTILDSAKLEPQNTDDCHFPDAADRSVLRCDKLATNGGEFRLLDGNDSFVGGPLGERVLGGDGDDRIDVKGSPVDLGSLLIGGRGNDSLIGGPGEDSIYGDQSNSSGFDPDAKKKFSGNDLLIGGGGLDVLDGRGGDDDIRSRDGIREDVTCGNGIDKAEVDWVDLVDDSCEKFERGDTSPIAPAGAVTKVKKITLKAGTIGNIKLNISCPESVTGGCFAVGASLYRADPAKSEFSDREAGSYPWHLDAGEKKSFAMSFCAFEPCDEHEPRGNVQAASARPDGGVRARAAAFNDKAHRFRVWLVVSSRDEKGRSRAQRKKITVVMEKGTEALLYHAQGLS